MQFTADGRNAATQATDLYKRLDTGQDELYVRWYAKYQAGAPWHHTGVWFGGYNPSSAWPNPQAGTRPLGNDRVSFAMEPVWGSGAPNPVFDFYNYWMTMHTCSGCGGSYWGNALISRTAFTASENTWACIEVDAKLNADMGSDAGAVREVWKDDAPRDCQERHRNADPRVLAEPDAHAAGLGALGHDEVRHRADEEQVSRERGAHRDHAPHEIRVGEGRYRVAPQDDRGDVRNQVGQRRHHAAHDHGRAPGRPALHQAERVVIDPGDRPGLVEAAHDHEQRGEEEQQGPFDPVDRVGRVSLGDRYHHRTRGDRDQRQRPAPEPRDHRDAEQHECFHDQRAVERHRDGLETLAERLAQLGAIHPPQVAVGGGGA